MYGANPLSTGIANTKTAPIRWCLYARKSLPEQDERQALSIEQRAKRDATAVITGALKLVRYAKRAIHLKLLVHDQSSIDS